MSYTKGPLRISGPSQGKGPNDDGGDYAIIEPGGVIVGEAFRRVGEDAYRDAEANARLWARAPDLVAILEAVIPIIEEYQRLAGDMAQFGDELYGSEPEEWLAMIESLDGILEQARAATSQG